MAVSTRALALVFLTVFLDLIGFGIILPILPFCVQSMGGDAQTLGWLLASFSLMQFVTTPLFGRLSDRFGRRPLILISLAGQAAAMLVLALAIHWAVMPLLFVGRIAAGATAGNVAACQAVVADVTSGPDRVRGMGRIGAAIGLGFVVGPFVGAGLNTIASSAPPLGACVLAALAFAGVLLWMPETHPDISRVPALLPLGPLAQGPSPPLARPPSLSLSRGPAQPSAPVFADARVLRLTSMFFLGFAGMSGLQVAAALLCQERLGWGEKEAGLAFGFFGAVMLLVQGAVVARLTRAVGDRGALLAASTCVGAGMAALALAHVPFHVWTAFALVATGCGIINAVVPSTASNYVGERSLGALMGTLQAAGGLARAVGPVWAGFLYTHVSSMAPFLFSAAMALVSFTLAWPLRTVPLPSRTFV
jgi:MFS family permease